MLPHLLLAAAAALPAVTACGGAYDAARAAHMHYARQAAASSSSASAASSASTAASSAASSASGASSAASSTGTGTATGTAATTTSSSISYSYSLAATNPTAVPLASITASASNVPTPSFTKPAAGSTPTYMSGAPALPDLSTWTVSKYPDADVIPPTDSDEVKQWIEDVKNSGVDIPTFSPTVTGGCAANPDAMADKSRCWWTCGGCVRDDDITDCPNKLQWGLTYDDGPSLYTPSLLQYLDEKSLKATFFIIGSRAVYNPAILQAEYLAGHQISVHTWSHHLLTEMTNEQIIAELGWSMKVIKDIIGVTPNTFRPPQGDMDDRVRAIAKALGLTPIMWSRISTTATFDTDDFSVNSGQSTVDEVLYNWKNIIGNASVIDKGFIVLEHDLFPQCVEIATGYILPDALAHQPAFDIKPVITCQGKKISESYIELAANTSTGKTTKTSSGASSSSTGNAALHVAAPGALAAVVTGFLGLLTLF